ncbi:hypothetical protein [Rossellomorea vietnamensis]|uniref:hypothetical protein n=1 Tax=Rossellomorea vietnamensis TaxID=218284 RepID=UPI003CF72BAE
MGTDPRPLELDEPPRLRLYKKRKRLGQLRQANVPKRKKGGFPFILFGLFDPEGLGAGTRRHASPAGGHTPSVPI